MATNTPAKKNTDLVETNETEETTNEAKAEKRTGPELVHFEVELANGKTVGLDALKNEEDWDIELLEHAQLGNYAVFLFGVLTWESRYKLRAAGAKTPDFETISIAYGEATGTVTSE